MSLLFSPFFSFPTKSSTFDNHLFSSLLNNDRCSKYISDKHNGRNDNSNSIDWNPSSDIIVDEQSITIVTELPGLKKEDINIDIKENILTISGEKREIKNFEQKPVEKQTEEDEEEKPRLEEDSDSNIDESNEKSTKETSVTNQNYKLSSFTRSEISYGSFKRTYQLPKEIDLNSVFAKHEDGVLTVKFDKKQPEQPKSTKIQIN